jgi:hypothetical protein
MTLKEDNTPWLSDESVSNIYRIDNNVYSKNIKEGEALFKFVNPHFTDEISYCYTYKNTNFKYHIFKHDLYYCSNKPLLLICLASLNRKQFLILLDNIGIEY